MAEETHYALLSLTFCGRQMQETAAEARDLRFLFLSAYA